METDFTRGRNPEPFCAAVAMRLSRRFKESEFARLLSDTGRAAGVSRMKAALANGAGAPSIAIVGAGPGGLAMAARLKSAGLSTVALFEKGTQVGGTWFDNHYPGAACDVPAYLYSFSFGPQAHWSRKYPTQPEILEYFETFAAHFDISEHVHLETEVLGATWDQDRLCWTVNLKDLREGSVRSEDFDIVINAVGQLSRPAIPSIPGLAERTAPVMHSARWDDSVDLAGKRVGVIGNGASALQFIPPVAEQAESLVVFQRSANWVLPKNDRAFTSTELARVRRFPALGRLYRWWIYWGLELRFALVRRESPLTRRLNETIVSRLQPLISEKLPAAAVVPDYPLGCKRILISNDYYKTLLRPNVTVQLAPIVEVTETDVRCADGTVIPADVLLLGTGFESTEFLAPMSFVGRHGVTLNDVWSAGAEAYLGLAVAGFPNLFIIYGPNTNLGHNSILFMIEAQTRYIMGLIEDMVCDGIGAVEVRPDVMDQFNSKIGALTEKTVWAESCHSWYKNESGKITNNWPGFSIVYWNRLRRRNRTEFILHARNPK